jgi:glucose dehydrogenase
LRHIDEKLYAPRPICNMNAERNAGFLSAHVLRLGPAGKQFVVIAARGHGKLGTKLGDSLVAFALP